MQLLEGKGQVPGNDRIVKRPEDKIPKRSEDKNAKGRDPVDLSLAGFKVAPGFIYGPTTNGVRQWTLDLKVVADRHIPGTWGMVGAAISADGLFLTCAYRKGPGVREGGHLLALGPDGDVVHDLYLTGSGLNAGSGIVVDASGRIYAASHEGVHEVASDFSGQRLLPVKFGRAAGIAVGAKGELFVADQSNNRIAVLDQERKFVRFIPTGPIPSGVAFGADGHLYYVDTPRRSGAGYLSRFVRVDLKKDDAEMVVKDGLAFLNSITFAEDGSYYLGTHNGRGLSHYSATGELLGSVAHSANALVDAVAIFSPNKVVKRKERPKLSDDPQPQQWVLAPDGGAEITCLSFSPDGQWLVTGSTDRLIRIWDVAKGVERKRFPVREGQIDSVIFSPSGRQLALNDGTSIFELPDAGPPVQQLSGGNGSKIAFSPDEKLIARVSGYGVRISEQGVAGLRELVGFEAPILCLAFSPDGRTLATGDANNVVKLWSVQTKELRATFTGHKAHVTDLTFAPDGRTLASASNDKTVRLWDLTTLQLRATLFGHAWGVLSVAFAPDSRTLVSCGAGGLVCRWRNEADEQVPAVQELDRPTAIRAAAFSPRRKLVATLASGVVKFSPVPRDGASPPDTAKFQALLDRKNALTIRVGGLLRGPVVFSPKGDTLFTTNADRHTTHTHGMPRIQTWETMTGRPKDTMNGAAPFALTPDGRTLLFVEWQSVQSQSLRLRNLRTGELLREVLQDQCHPATGEMALSPDGETVLIAYGKTLSVYDLPIRQRKKIWDHFDGRILHVAFAPDGKTFAVALEVPKFPVLLCDSATGTIRAKCLGHRLAVRAMAFTPDSKRLLTGSMDHTIRLWDAVTGKEIALVGSHETVKEQQGEVVALAVHRAGKILASAGGDGVLNLWDLDKQKKLLALRPHPQARPLVGAAFSADGKFLAACTEYDYITLWDVERLLRDSAPLIAAIAEPTVTLLVEIKTKYANPCRVLGLGADGKPLWQFDTSNIVTDAHMVGADRVLYTVDSQRMLIESDLRGKIVSSKKVNLDCGRNTIRSAQRRPNGTTLCAFAFGLVEIDTRGKEHVLYQRQRIGGDAITDVRELPNGTIGLVTTDGLYRLLDARGQEIKNVRIIPRQEFSGGKIDVLQSGGVLVTDWNKNKVVEFDAEGKWVWEANVKTPTSVSRLPNGNTLVTSQEDCCAVELDQTGKEVWRYQGKGQVLLARRLPVPGLPEQQDNVPRIFRRLKFQGHLEAPGAVAFARDGQVLMTLANQIKIWRVSDLRELEAAPLVRRSTLVALEYTPDLQTICACDNKGRICLYHWNSPEAATAFTLPLTPGKSLAAAACSPDGKRMAESFTNERTIEIWDIAEKKLLHKLPQQAHHLMKFAFSPDGKLLVSSGGDSKVKFWDVAGGQEIASLTPRPIEGTKFVELGASTFSPDGKTLAMRGENDCIRLWDIETRAVRTIVRPSASPCCLAFSADSKLLATGMRDGMIHVWDVATGTHRGSLAIDERREIRAVAFSPDSSKLAVCCGQELQLWDLRRSPLRTVLKTP